MKRFTVAGGRVYQTNPGFLHDIGDDVHHVSMTRTCETDEDGQFIPGTGVSHRRYVIHVFLDDFFFYPFKSRIMMHDAMPGYTLLSAALGFLWGLNCGFPPRDVALWTVWYLRGCHRDNWDLEEFKAMGYGKHLE